MAGYRVGDTLTVEVPLFDTNGAPIPTASSGDFTATIRHTARDGTRSAATVGPFAYDAGGLYLAAIAGALEGRYSGTIVYAGPPAQPFGWEADVETAAQADPAASVTALYGALLANLDAAVSSRATPAEVAAVQAGLLATFTAVTFTSSVDPLTSRVTIHQGDDETLPWTVTSPSLTGATAILRVFRGSTDVTATLTAVETAALSLGTPAYKYELIATLAGGGIKTLAAGDVWVRD
jgi:hypothetical protein